MAAKRQRPNGQWEYQFERKGLIKRTYLVFDSERDGDKIAARVEAILERGEIPAELLKSKMGTLGALLDLYEVLEDLAPSAKTLIPTLHNLVGGERITVLTDEWVDKWVDEMKVAKLAPTTIKKRVELLARAVDWGIRKKHVALVTNPLRHLPVGYFTKGIDRNAWQGQRDRRLSEDGAEERAIRSVLIGKEEHLLFDMALESAMRLREMYTLTRDQIHLNKGTIFLEKTKNGDKRQVPVSSVLMKLLTEYLATLEGDKLFSWWDGSLDERKLEATSNRLSQRFARRFAKAGCGDLRFHDLRHEATSRIYERTKLTDLEVATITGHKDPRMLKRYANIRGSSLAMRLW